MRDSRCTGDLDQVVNSQRPGSLHGSVRVCGCVSCLLGAHFCSLAHPPGVCMTMGGFGFDVDGGWRSACSVVPENRVV